MSDGPGVAATARGRALRDAFDVGIESADGCLWVVIDLDVDDIGLEASIHPADAEVLLRDLRGGVALSKVEGARIDAATE